MFKFTKADQNFRIKLKLLPTGLEPVTLGLLDLHSNQLSYESLKNMLSVLA
jgi:hypothetical protein